MAKIFCIYVFSDEWTIPKYVGKTKDFDNRVKQHLIRDRFRYDSWFYRWLNKQISEDKEYFIDILEEVNQENWKEKEKYWIKHIQENGYKLTNMTEGGDGNNNQVFSKESLHKRSLSLKGHIVTEETRKKISRGHMGKSVSAETRRKLSEFNKGKPCSDIVRSKLSKSLNQYDLNENFIQTFVSLTEGANFLNCRKSSLNNAMRRKKDGKFKNFLWRYSTK